MYKGSTKPNRNITSYKVIRNFLDAAPYQLKYLEKRLLVHSLQKQTGTDERSLLPRLLLLSGVYKMFFTAISFQQ